MPTPFDEPDEMPGPPTQVVTVMLHIPELEVGASEGIPEGAADGEKVGEVLVGSSDGARLGADDGAMLGVVVGDWVEGLTEGALVGDRVDGAREGEKDG